MADWWRSFFRVTTFILGPVSVTTKHLMENTWKKPSHRERSLSRNGSTSIKETVSNKGSSRVLKLPSAWRWQACTNTLPRWAVVTVTPTTTTTPHPHTHVPPPPPQTNTHTHTHLARQKSLSSASALSTYQKADGRHKHRVCGREKCHSTAGHTLLLLR